MKALVIGREGQVARALARRGGLNGVSITSLGRPELDLARPDEIAELISRYAPDIVINAAAYTAVDQAETERDLAFAVNGAGAGAVARAAAALGLPIIHVSTDYVFSGDKSTPYVEVDATGPASAYGASKLEGERLVAAAHPRAIIVRTAWVYDAQGRNFMRTMLRIARAREEVGVVADQCGCPTFANDLADALLEIAKSGADRAGIYHCAGAGETSWAEFAQAVFALSIARGGPSATVIPITTADYPSPAPRPANSRLDCSKLAKDYGVVMRPWREALSDCIDEIAASGWRVE